ncbi:hypothetical protein P872_18800 [Rhodonellum psychrophilum GCM71 = DSM 17998]|uniref:Uncharacterized protein n=1 Tax=Rhodonellum psychrophilum GCM71 = DSM 17998 TaxID=1123057 RepID=U5BWH8_9BACT|nr:hypothetical protein P872_18800 [Rhodonellum psychrophilum GCM71 = DSM 17998]
MSIKNPTPIKNSPKTIVVQCANMLIIFPACSYFVRWISIPENSFQTYDVADFQHKGSMKLLLMNLTKMMHGSISVTLLANRF